MNQETSQQVCDCKLICVPEHLVWDGMTIETSVPEFLYRRFRIVVEEPWRLMDEVTSVEIFAINDDSYNRADMCKDFSDVLIASDKDNCKKGATVPHFKNWGVLKLNYSAISNSFNWTHSTSLEPFNISIRAIHTPLLCNNSHSELIVTNSLMPFNNFWTKADAIKLDDEIELELKRVIRNKLIIPFLRCNLS